MSGLIFDKKRGYALKIFTVFSKPLQSKTMGYSHEQPSKASKSMYTYGVYALIMIIVFNILAPITENYWMFGVAGCFYWMIGYLASAKYYNKLTVKDEDDKRL